MSEMLLRTANHFGVPLAFTTCKEPFRCLYSKLPKVLKFLQEQPENIEYMFFTDCRDSVFTDTAANILALFNRVYEGGVLFSCGGKGLAVELFGSEMREMIAARYSMHGYVNSGTYCGRVSDVMKLLTRAIALHDALVSGDTSDPLANAYLSNPDNGVNVRAEGRRIVYRDEPLFQLIQTGIDEKYANMLKIDIDKQVIAFFGNTKPNQGHIPIKTRRTLHPTCLRSVGTAGILHSPALSRSLAHWQWWVENNLLTSRDGLGLLQQARIYVCACKPERIRKLPEQLEKLDSPYIIERELPNPDGKNTLIHFDNASRRFREQVTSHIEVPLLWLEDDCDIPDNFLEVWAEYEKTLPGDWCVAVLGWGAIYCDGEQGLVVSPFWSCLYFLSGVPVNVQRNGFANVSLKYSTNDSIRFCISSNEEKLLRFNNRRHNIPNHISI